MASHMTTREQLHVCGALTDYSEEEIEKIIAAAREHMPGCSEPEIFTVVLAAMRSDHAGRAIEQHKRSIGQPVFRVLSGSWGGEDPENRPVAHLRLLQGGVTRHDRVDREDEWPALQATLNAMETDEESPDGN
jgi:hypothetical protein